MPKSATYPKIQKNIEPDLSVIKPRKNGSVTKMPTVANKNIRVCQRPNKVGVINWELGIGNWEFGIRGRASRYVFPGRAWERGCN